RARGDPRHESDRRGRRHRPPAGRSAARDRRPGHPHRLRHAARRRSRVRRPRDGRALPRPPPRDVTRARLKPGSAPADAAEDPRAKRLAARPTAGVEWAARRTNVYPDLRTDMPIVDTQLVLYDEDYRKVLGVCERLARDAHAKGVFIVDKNGQLLAEAGDTRGLDTTSLASLTAGSIAATGGLAKIIGEEEFPIHFHQGVRDNLHMTVVG